LHSGVHTVCMDTPLAKVLEAVKDQPLNRISDDQKGAVLERVLGRDRESAVEVARFTSAI
jgi:hypothetical protein